MKAIYEPGGRTEFAKLALNLYAGCSHGCRYCYNKDKFPGSCADRVKKSSFENIESDLRKLDGTDRIHLSYVGDPYDLGRQDNRDMRQVLIKLRKHNHPFQILTKGGTKAVEDFDLYGPNDWFGATLTFDNDADSKTWEPGAALPEDRISALRIAHERGIRTWVSLEPVIDPAQTLHLIDMAHEFVDLFWVGKLNHMPELEAKIDWPKFRTDAKALLQRHGKQYKIKYDLSTM